MQQSPSSELSVQVLTWINAELRKEIERRSQAEAKPPLSERIRLPLMAGLSSVVTISLIVTALAGGW